MLFPLENILFYGIFCSGEMSYKIKVDITLIYLSSLSLVGKKWLTLLSMQLTFHKLFYLTPILAVAILWFSSPLFLHAFSLFQWTLTITPVSRFEVITRIPPYNLEIQQILFTKALNSKPKIFFPFQL